MAEIENLQSNSLYLNTAQSEWGPVDIAGISESIDKAVSVNDSDEIEDSNLDPLTQHRGIFLMGAEREEEQVEIQENTTGRKIYSL
jgi:hypothetical protein